MPADRRRPHSAEAPAIGPGAVVAEKYVVEDVLGAGSMGFVVSATHKLIGQKVAIKFIKAAYVDSHDALARFKREARALVAVQSENVVRVFDYGTMPDESPYLVMEYLTGRDLQRELRARRSIPLEEAAEIVVQACEGLAAVHARGIVHRDIKPANIFLSQRANGKRVVKIVDFGISKAPKTNDDEPTITKASIGSPHYMSPEQLRNSPGVDPRSDVWSLGVTLYRALTGELPFAGESVVSLLAAVASEEPRGVREGRPDLPIEIDTIVKRCLAKNADDRYATVQELADALAPFAMPSDAAPSENVPSAPNPNVDERAPAPAENTVLHESTSRTEIASMIPGSRSSAPPVVWKPHVALAAAIGIPLALVTIALRLAPLHAAKVANLTEAAVSSGSALPPPPARAITDPPLPKTANPAAAAAYMAGLQAVRDASLGEASDAFERAATLDPTLAAAQLRRALYGQWLIGAQARRHVRSALALRASLSEEDRELLGAVEPLYLRPQPAVDEAQQRIDELSAARPADAECLFLSATLFLTRRPRAAVLEIADRIAAVDPRFAGAAWLRALVAALDANAEGARRAVEDCLAISPAAASCVSVRATLEDLAGECTALEADARRIVAMDDGSAVGQEFLARALFARDQAIDAVRESLSRAWQATPERARSSTVLLDEARLAIARGDFATALSSATDLDRLAEAGGTEEDRRGAALLLIDVDTELGDVTAAARVADTYLRRIGAWSAIDAIDEDPRPRLYAAAARGGLRTGAERDLARTEWTTFWKGQVAPLERARVWIEGYAVPAVTREEARSALAVLPDYAPIPPLVLAGPTLPALAKVHALAGDAADALPELRAVASSCHALADPIAHTHALFLLGQALETAGDTPGACAAYGSVLARWGSAKRSVTAASASLRVRALGCGR